MPIPKRTETSDKTSAVGPAWKNQSRFTITVYSCFGGDDALEVTVILSDESRGNRFWDKHVLRSGEDAEDVLSWRDPMKSEDYASASMGYEIFGDKINQGVSGSTVAQLSIIGERLAYYAFAKALVDAMRGGDFGDATSAPDGVRVDVTVNFEKAHAVKTLEYPLTVGGSPGQRDHTASPSMIDAQAMRVTGCRKSRLDNDEITFEIDHCHYACSADGGKAS